MHYARRDTDITAGDATSITSDIKTAGRPQILVGPTQNTTLYSVLFISLGEKININEFHEQTEIRAAEKSGTLTDKWNRNKQGRCCKEERYRSFKYSLETDR